MVWPSASTVTTTKGRRFVRQTKRHVSVVAFWPSLGLSGPIPTETVSRLCTVGLLLGQPCMWSLMTAHDHADCVTPPHGRGTDRAATMPCIVSPRVSAEPEYVRECATTLTLVVSGQVGNKEEAHEAQNSHRARDSENGAPLTRDGSQLPSPSLLGDHG